MFRHSCKARLSLPPSRISSILKSHQSSSLELVKTSNSSSITAWLNTAFPAFEAIRYWHTRHAILHSTLSTQARRLPSSARSTQSLQITASTSPENKEKNTKSKDRMSYLPVSLILPSYSVSFKAEQDRSRRVKCDEIHPVCKNCQKHYVSCTYPVPIEKPKHCTSQKAIKLHPLVPKGRPAEPTPSLQGHEMRAGPRFTDAIEARYFVYYCEGISSQIGVRSGTSCGTSSSRRWGARCRSSGVLSLLSALCRSLSPSDRRRILTTHTHSRNTCAPSRECGGR
jgi:hypothetical protein